MTVAAVIPHWNRRDLLAALLESLQKQICPFDEVIVADNGSTDGSPEVAERAGARVLRLDRNLGFAAAVNRGIEVATSEWVAVLNNDVILEPDWLSRIAASLGGEDVWFATGKILSAADHKLIDGTFDEIARSACAWRCGAGRPDGPVWNVSRRIRIAPMTAAIFRRRLFSDLGGLDESFESYLEDVEFGVRCAIAGREGIYVPSAVAYHRGSATLGRWNKDTVRALARNQILLAAKHFRELSAWPLVAGQLLWGAVALRHGRGWSFFRGKLEGLRRARAIRSKPIPASREGLQKLLDASEKEILTLQRQTGFDGYWRAYFWLLRQ